MSAKNLQISTYYFNCNYLNNDDEESINENNEENFNEMFSSSFRIWHSDAMDGQSKHLQIDWLPTRSSKCLEQKSGITDLLMNRILNDFSYLKERNNWEGENEVVIYVTDLQDKIKVPTNVESEEIVLPTKMKEAYLTTIEKTDFKGGKWNEIQVKGESSNGDKSSIEKKKRWFSCLTYCGLWKKLGNRSKETTIIEL